MSGTGDVPSNAPEHCPGTSSEEAGKAAACAGCPNQQICASAPKGPDPDLAAITQRMSSVKHVILVLSGKGGVGKSTFSAQLAFALAAQQKEVGLLDIDICGPSVPKMLGLEGQEVHSSGAGWSPVYPEPNLGVMSIGFMLPDPDEAVIWRGPRKNGLIKQFLKDVDWGELDYLVIDAPPGTSDEHITIAQCLKATQPDGAVIVTTPQEVAIIDVRKEINFCRKVGLRVLGVVENMTPLVQRLPALRFLAPGTAQPAASTNGHGEDERRAAGVASSSGQGLEDVTEKVMECLKASFPGGIQDLMVQSEVFGASKGGAEKMCRDMQVPLLGRVPLDPAIGQAAEEGRSAFEPKPGSTSGPSAVSLAALQSIVDKLLKLTDAETQPTAV